MGNLVERFDGVVGNENLDRCERLEIFNFLVLIIVLLLCKCFILIKVKKVKKRMGTEEL